MCGRWVLPAVLLLAGASMLAQAPASWPQIRAVSLIEDLDEPTDIQSARDGSRRLFIVEQSGLIRIFKDGALQPVPFLDIRSRVTNEGERGLLGLAFPPNFPEKRHFYVNYTTGGDPPALRTVISRFAVTSNPDWADPNSEQVVLTFRQPATNHNGGQLAFGPDGYLYIGTGDGGGANDTDNNAQSTNTLLGKMLRIDVESGSGLYRVPAGNPFTGNPDYRPEIWAVGLRNPWRYAFDRVTGDLYIGDVGQDSVEEVSFQPAVSRGGENYGWNVVEGMRCLNTGCSTAGLVPPVATFGHEQGCAVMGGYVYRGQRYPELQGIYFYADYCTGRIWGLRRNESGWENRLLLETGLFISTFGEDEAGDIYLAHHGSGTGEAYRLVAGAPALSSASVVNAASFAPGVTPGWLATVFTTGLLAVNGVASAGTTPLPEELLGTRVVFNGLPAPIYAVADLGGREQINVQVPWELAGATKATVVVMHGGVQSPAAEIDVLPAQPGVFAVDERFGAILHGDSFRLVSPANPADGGEVVAVFATGLGPVENPPPTGHAAATESLSPARLTGRVTIGGLPAEVLFSGLAPALVGVGQINVRVPAEAPSGLHDLVVSVGQQSSRPVKIAVR